MTVNFLEELRLISLDSGLEMWRRYAGSFLDFSPSQLSFRTVSNRLDEHTFPVRIALRIALVPRQIAATKFDGIGQ